MKIDLKKLLIYYCIVYFSFKILSPINIFNIYFVYLASLILLLIMNNKSTVRKALYLIAPAIIYATIALIIYYSKDISLTYWNTIDNYFKIQSVVILYGCVSACDKVFQKSCIKVAFVGWYLTMISSLINVVIDPDILRSTASIPKASNIYVGYGGYDFVYGTIIVNCIVLYYLLDKKRYSLKTKSSFFLILFVLLSNIMNFLSSYTTATILNVFFEFLVVIKYLKMSTGKLIVIAVVIFALTQITNVISLLRNWEIFSSLTESRLLNIYSIMQKGESFSTNSDFNARLSRAKLSWNLFIKHPLLGNFITESNVNTGMHTEWIDKLAQYGVLIFSMIVWFWAENYKFSIRKFKENNLDVSIVKITYLYFLILGFLNPACYVLTIFPLLFFLPLTNVLFE